MEAARPVVIFVSGPNWGSLTGAEPFDQNVFENGLRIADMREDFEVGYDQAGSSSADPRDFEPGKEDEKMRAAGKIGTAPPGQGVDWTDKKSVEKSHWFAGYVQRLKGIALSKSQDKTVTLIIFLCVEGGPITQLEQQKIGEIVREAKADNAMKGITKEIEISLVSYKMFVDKYDKPMELADPTIPELFEQLNLSKYSDHFTSEGYAQLSDLQDLSDEEELDGLISGAGMKKPEAKRLRKGLSKNLIPEGVPGQPAAASAAQVTTTTPRSHGAAGGLDDCKPVEHSNSAKTPPVSVSSQPQDDTEELESAEMLRIGSATRQSNGFALSKDERGSSVVAPMSPVLVGVGITAAAMAVATIASRN